MIKKSKLFFIIAETPLHPGSGGEITGLVDLPIQRERHTNFPKVEASGLKGCIREAFNDSVNINDKNLISLVFGPEDTEEAYAGALAFTDARILLFPVKSLKGVFTWITCPLVLERFKEDLRLAGENYNFSIQEEIKEGSCLISDESTIIIDDQIVLEEYTFKYEKKNEVKEISQFFAQKIFPQQQNNIYKFWHDKLKKDLVILSNDDFEQFVTSSTEVITRTKINDTTGTVESGALWTEEYLPQDTILYSIVMASPVRVEDDAKGVFKADTTEEEVEKVIKFFESKIPEVIQIGGNQTIGKGIAKIQILK
jgi:CRISPR-associated protein Cmr4